MSHLILRDDAGMLALHNSGDCGVPEFYFYNLELSVPCDLDDHDSTSDELDGVCTWRLCKYVQEQTGGDDEGNTGCAGRQSRYRCGDGLAGGIQRTVPASCARLRSANGDSHLIGFLLGALPLNNPNNEEGNAG